MDIVRVRRINPGQGLPVGLVPPDDFAMRTMRPPRPIACPYGLNPARFEVDTSSLQPDRGPAGQLRTQEAENRFMSNRPRHLQAEDIRPSRPGVKSRRLPMPGEPFIKSGERCASTPQLESQARAGAPIFSRGYRGACHSPADADLPRIAN